MSRVAINRRKIKVNLILKSFFFFLFILLIITISFFLFFNNYKYSFVSNYIEFFSKKYDYLLTEIEINGLKNVSEIEIKNYFKNYYNKSIFLIPIKKISQSIKKNKWIESIIIKNNFNNKISINIKEFKPIAVYFNGKSYFLINKFSDVIDFADNKEMQKYLIFEGQNAINKVTDLIVVLPIDLKPFIIKAQYINNRRWDIITKENLIIKLPEIEYKKAISIFNDIYKDLYTSDITKIEYIDLRISQKAIIKFYNEQK